MLKPMLSAVLAGTTAFAIQPEVAQLSFDARFPQVSTHGQPAWIVRVEQQGGQFTDQPKCWHVPATQPVGVGRLAIHLNRDLLREDLALSVLYEETADADFVVQLFDAGGRVIVLDLFANLMVVGKEAKTDTFIVPLRKYPSATQIVLRRITGDVKVYGAALCPVVGEAEGDTETLRELAKLLGDPLSPQNPLAIAVGRIAQTKGLDTNRLQQIPGVTRPADRPLAARIVPQPLETLWEALPWLKLSDWPEPRGEPAVVGRDELLLQGRPVRRQPALTTPVHLEFDLWLEQRVGNDGGLWVSFVPADKPKDREPDQCVTVALTYQHGSPANEGELHIIRAENTLRGPVVWKDKIVPFEAGAVYHVEMDAVLDRMVVRCGERRFDIPHVGVPYDRFCVQLRGWQPNNRWHVRNFAAR